MKIRTAIMLALLMTGLFNQFAWAGDTIADARKRGVLIVGVRDDAPPFGFIDRDTGETVGVDADLAAAIAKRLDVKLRLKAVTAAGWIPDLLDGKVDLVAAAVASTPDRAKLVDFSQPYFSTTQRVLARKGTVSTVKELAGKKVGVGPGSPAEREIKAQAPGAACYFFSDSRKALEALQKGEVDALSASGSNLYGCLSALPKGEFEIPESIKLSEDAFRLALRKGDPKFLELVNATLAELNSSGGTRAILDKWFQGKGNERKLTAAIRSAQSTGVVTRATSTVNRFLVLPITGYFRPSADVSIFDPNGNLVGEGRVASIYEEETYVDAGEAAAGLVRPGFLVALNSGPEDVKQVIADHKSVIEQIRADAKAEEVRINQEAGAEFQQAKKERAQYQEDVTKTKMMLDYQYSDQYYRYYGYPFR
ncbi:MAG TPA: transporter substrate-binding domain-containing protein [Candidatus Deferrimicrobiaceae bacterium]